MLPGASQCPGDNQGLALRQLGLGVRGTKPQGLRGSAASLQEQGPHLQVSLDTSCVGAVTTARAQSSTCSGSWSERLQCKA